MLDKGKPLRLSCRRFREEAQRKERLTFHLIRAAARLRRLGEVRAIF